MTWACRGLADRGPGYHHHVLPDEENPPRIDPRFLLANERTFLAWSRTALALVAAGLAVTQLLREFDIPFGRRMLGLPLIVVGGTIGYSASRRRMIVEAALARGDDLPRSRLPGLLSAVIVVTAALAAVLAVAGTRG